MIAKLFVRTPTNFRDYETVISPKDVEDNDKIIDRINSAYQSINYQIKEQFMYLAVNLKKYVFAGAWLDIASLGKDKLVEEKYCIRNRNTHKQESYYAFVGFFFEKTKENINIEICNLDFILAFNDVIAKIWDRNESKDYLVEEAWFSISESNKEVDKSVLQTLNQDYTCFINNNEPTIVICNNIVNFMISDYKNIYSSFCSNFKNKKEFSKQIKFNYGCSYKKTKHPKDFLEKYVIYDPNNIKNNTVLNNCSSDNSISCSNRGVSLERATIIKTSTEVDDIHLNLNDHTRDNASKISVSSIISSSEVENLTINDNVLSKSCIAVSSSVDTQTGNTNSEQSSTIRWGSNDCTATTSDISTNSRTNVSEKYFNDVDSEINMGNQNNYSELSSNDVQTIYITNNEEKKGITHDSQYEDINVYKQSNQLINKGEKLNKELDKSSNDNKQFNINKQKKKNIFKKILKFITTDIRDLREVMNEDED